MDTLYTVGDKITHYKSESVNFLGLMNSAIKKGSLVVPLERGFFKRIWFKVVKAFRVQCF